MPRADRRLPFRERVAKHAATKPKCSPPTLKKRIGALQALLTYALHQRWSANNAGTGILIVGYNKTPRVHRSFEDHELATLFACPLFVNPLSWSSSSRISDATAFWLFLLALTTRGPTGRGWSGRASGRQARWQNRRPDIDEYVIDEDSKRKVSRPMSFRLIPVHAKLIELGFLEYCDALTASGQTQLFPDLKENSVGKRTKEASQKVNRIIDRYVSADRRLVFHSLRHAFKSKGNDASFLRDLAEKRSVKKHGDTQGHDRGIDREIFLVVL